MIVRSFYGKLAALSLILALPVFVVYMAVPLLYENFAWLSLIFFFILTMITFPIALNGLKKSSGHAFVASVNGMVMLKIFLSIAFIIIYILVEKPKSPVFILPFFVFYIVFTFFEIRQLLIAQKILIKQNTINR